jgi:hypothetical protein
MVIMILLGPFRARSPTPPKNGQSGSLAAAPVTM